MGSTTALVIGGGIVGMQTSLDIANAGFRVILVERDVTIGGHMLQYSEVFPTMDCPQCIGTPKMVEVASHPNIELMVYSEVVGVTGKAGEFKVRIKKKAKYIDPQKCTGCGDCAQVCPVSWPDEWNAGIVTRKAPYMGFPQAVPAKYVIDKRGISPCGLTCPAGVNVYGCIALISQRKFGEAFELISQRVPFPGVVGRVCPHRCERGCNRGRLDGPLAIAALERFAAYYPTAPSFPEPTKERVAIIGAGPAGLTVAYRMALQDYRVTIFDALEEIGGMLRVGIPEYRLPKEVLSRELELIKDGIEVKTGIRIDKEKFKELKEQYSAIFIGVGAHRGLKLNIPGGELEGVIHGLSFLKKVNLGEEVKIGKRVLVIGGDYVAIDAARVALRLGAEVHVLYQKARADMTASDEEVGEAEDEGVRIEFSVLPVRVLGNGKVTGIECVRVEWKPDATGRKRLTPIESSEFVLQGDTVLLATGRAPELDFLDGSGIELTGQGTISTTNGCATSVPGIFAGGDSVRGAATVVEAIADGNEAAEDMETYLKGEGWTGSEPRRLKTVRLKDLDLRKVKERRQVTIPKSPVEKRIHSFEEVRLPLTEEEAVEEAKRCLNCAGCCECRECEKVCEAKAINHEDKEEYEEREVGAIIVATGFEPFDPYLKPEYGYGQYSNVITALEMERLDIAGGPTDGKIMINGKEPGNVVFIQCVGSRDKSVGNEYCSRVCCMYAAKQALYVKEKIPEARVTICYIDIRAYGKGYEQFYQRVQNRGVIYRRGSVSEIYRKGDKLIVRAEDTLLGEFFEEEADLVVLAVGLVPSIGTVELAKALNIPLGSDGFLLESHPKLAAVETGIKGIYLAGCCQGPKDIPDSVAQASAAASIACTILSQAEEKV